MDIEMPKEIHYEGYYDDVGNFCIDINKDDAEKLIKKITGVDEVFIK